MRIMLVFPPGWSLNTGGPHIALPLIGAYLKANRFDVKIADLNLGMTEYLGVRLNPGEIVSAVRDGSLDSLNDIYFPVEDQLNEIAKPYNAVWNAQLGLTHDNYSFDSSKDCLEAATQESPFVAYYKKIVLPSIDDFDPHIIGFNIASRFQIIPALQLCYLIKKSGSDSRIVLGGNTISRLFDDMKLIDLFRLVDYLAVYQGEDTMLNLSAALEEGSSVERVANIAWCDGETIRTNQVKNVFDPNEVPAPDFEDLPLGDYWGMNYLPALAGRGCYHGKCYFCAIPFGWGSDGYAGKRDNQLVLHDIMECIEEYGIRNFKFVDESLHPKTMLYLGKKLKESGLSVKWEGYTRLEKCWLDEQFVKTVSEGGFRKAYFGLEILPKSGKSLLGKHDYAHPLPIIKRCFDYGIKVHLFCMFGFPGTGAEEAHETMEFIFDNLKYIDTVDVFSFGYARHTNVSRIKPTKTAKNDWALEYRFQSPDKDVLDSESVEELAKYYEEIVFHECPRLIHPIYRLHSPWA